MQSFEKQATDHLKNVELLGVMPARLVMLRHGESEANLINRAIKRGIISEYPVGFSEIPDREIRLSKRGVEQALLTGPWLRSQYPNGFDVIYASDHTRAKETAALVCQSANWEDVEIKIDPLLGERNWGRFALETASRRDEIMQSRRRDPLHVPLPDGETMLETRNRSRELLERVSRQYTAKRVLVFSHGEYIEAIWAEIAHMHTERQVEFFNSAAGDIKNCQAIEFSALDPSSNEYTGKFKWVRSSCPQAQIFTEWENIKREKFSPTQLLEQVKRYPNLDFPELAQLS